MGHVFVSYSRQDAEYVTRLVQELRTAGVEVWVDEEIESGDRWEDLIRGQVDGCRVFLPVMSPHAESSVWVGREIARAQAKGKQIIPLLLAGELFFRLADLQYEDVSGGRMPRPELIQRIRRALELDPSTPMPPAPTASVPTPSKFDRRRAWVAAGVTTALVLAAGAVAAWRLTADGGSTSLAQPPGATAPTTPVLGPPTKTVQVGVDLPFQGRSVAASTEAWNALQLYLDSVSNRAGTYRVELVKYDNATAERGNWDAATCTANAKEHMANATEVAVIGTRNTGCTQVEAPLLNLDTDGPMLMVSGWESYPRLTRTWDTGEPEKYFPSTKRGFARVITTEDMEGAAGAQFAGSDLGAKKCFVLNDGFTYGKAVAKLFVDSAAAAGVTITGQAQWKGADKSYTTLFTQIKATGANCVYFGGVFDVNGAQLTRDKVAVLGDNTAVKLITPSGWAGYPEFVALPEAAGAYISFVGLWDSSLSSTAAAAALRHAYETKYGAAPTTIYAYYGVQSLQMILAALEKSDGTRRGVRDQVFSGTGVTVGADKAMLGRACTIDPSTGDVNIKDFAFNVVSDGKENFYKTVTLT